MEELPTKLSWPSSVVASLPADQDAPRLVSLVWCHSNHGDIKLCGGGGMWCIKCMQMHKMHLEVDDEGYYDSSF